MQDRALFSLLGGLHCTALLSRIENFYNRSEKKRSEEEAASKEFDDADNATGRLTMKGSKERW